MAAVPVANMQQYLEDVLQMNPQGKRQKFQEAGVTTLNALVRKSDEFAHKASQTMRKSTTGQAPARDVSLEEETRLHRLVIFCRFRYMTQSVGTSKISFPLRGVHFWSSG